MSLGVGTKSATPVSENIIHVKVVGRCGQRF